MGKKNKKKTQAPSSILSNNPNFYNINVNFGRQFFFFESLRDRQIEEAQVLAQKVDNVLNQSFIRKTPNNAKYFTQITNAYNFLKAAAENERKEEISFFTKALKNPNLNSKFVEDAQAILSKQPLDYLAFINLINQAVDTEHKYQLLLQKESERLKLVEEAVTAYRQTINKRERFSWENFKTFLTDNQISIDRTYTNQIEFLIQRYFSQIINDTRITEILRENSIHDKVVSNQEVLAIQAIIIEALLEKMPLKDLYQNEKKNFINTFNSFLNSQEDNTLKELAKIAYRRIEELEEVGLSISKISHNYQLKENNIQKGKAEHYTSLLNFTKENRAILEDIPELGEKLKNNNNESLWGPKTYNQYKKIVYDFFNQGDFNSTYQAIREAIGLSTSYLKIQKSFISEMRGATKISQTISLIAPDIISSELNGTQGHKSDYTTIALGEQEYTFNFDSLTKTILQTVLSEVGNIRERLFQKIQKLHNTNKKQDFHSMNLSQKVTKNIIEKQIKEQIVNSEQQEKALQALKESLVVEGSVKEYNYLNNNFGFDGGSLGPNYMAQTEELYKLMMIGGLNPPSLQWLQFAVLNSGSRLLGHSLLNPLQRYFSAVAGLLLLNDTEDQIQAVTLENNYLMKKNSPSKLHFFNLNGIIFPASFILQKTYEVLRTNAEKMMRDVKGGGVQVTISHGHLNESVLDIYRDKETQLLDVSAWKKTYIDNQSKVNIKMSFLAGFMDIIEQLNNQMKSW